MEDPEAEAVLLPVVNGLTDARPGRLLGKRLAVGREGLHHQGIGVEAVDFGEVRGGDGVGEKAGGGEGGERVGHGAILPFCSCG